MNFRLQTGNPETLEVGSAEDMADATGQMYLMETEDAILFWNRVPVRLAYRYDIPALIDDLVPLLEEVQSPEFSQAQIHWGSDTFSTEWTIARDGDFLRIDSRWDSVHGSYEFLLNERSQLAVRIDSFVAEWLKVLRRITSDLVIRHVRLEDDDIATRAKTLSSKSNRPLREQTYIPPDTRPKTQPR
ncbi:hypothetical protein BKA00_002486 [Actinomadura coerulea]|uniref:Uncharacterized protein n=1 Tax=Actinomadura coerulea TaxID=46159 RepID=A0A7X0FYQ3_9ACTN|nr:hypothetical protein [Actinomadura coerulea]MBB6395572.1 hypothetical protein [Actinomadura coerulea]GGQ25365.1 hypothetical protein GCM10010187_47330 [Actinomadura coerulea]